MTSASGVGFEKRPRVRFSNREALADLLVDSAWHPRPCVQVGHNRKIRLVLFVKVWYVFFGAAIDGGRLAPGQGAASCPLISRKGGCPMVTYSELFAYSLVIIGICGLFIQVYKKK